MSKSELLLKWRISTFHTDTCILYRSDLMACILDRAGWISNNNITFILSNCLPEAIGSSEGLALWIGHFAAYLAYFFFSEMKIFSPETSKKQGLAFIYSQIIAHTNRHYKLEINKVHNTRQYCVCLHHPLETARVSDT